MARHTPKISKNEKRLVDAITGKTLSRHKSGMVAQKAARRLAAKTGHPIKLVDDYGTQFTFQPDNAWKHGNPRRRKRITTRSSTLLPAKVRVNPRTGKVQVFVSPKVAAQVKGRNPLTGSSSHIPKDQRRAGYMAGEQNRYKTGSSAWGDYYKYLFSNKGRRAFLAGFKSGRKAVSKKSKAELNK
jgi:hypothetical protein